MDTTDYKQIAFKLQSDIEQLKWEQAQKDLPFLKEIKERLEKWKNNNDWSERDMVFDMIDHWIYELEELNE